MKINLPIGWMSGYLRYGHFEGEVEMDIEAEKEFKSLIKKEIEGYPLTEEEYDKLDDYKDWITEECVIKIDDYRLDEYGDIDWGEILND